MNDAGCPRPSGLGAPAPWPLALGRPVCVGVGDVCSMMVNVNSCLCALWIKHVKIRAIPKPLQLAACWKLCGPTSHHTIPWRMIETRAGHILSIAQLVRVAKGLPKG